MKRLDCSGQIIQTNLQNHALRYSIGYDYKTTFKARGAKSIGVTICNQDDFWSNKRLNIRQRVYYACCLGKCIRSPVERFTSATNDKDSLHARGNRRIRSTHSSDSSATHRVDLHGDDWTGQQTLKDPKKERA
jgi:hypothetical protein